MFGFGFSELIIIFCVIIILINPKDFPRLAKKAGSFDNLMAVIFSVLGSAA